MTMQIKQTVRFTETSTMECKIALLRAKLNQTDFAGMAGVSGSDFSQMLAGQRLLTPEVIAALRKHLPEFAKAHLPAEVA